MATKCDGCGAVGAVTLGFNELVLRAVWLCGCCQRAVGPRDFKTTLCHRAEGSRACVASRGREHIHTSQGSMLVAVAA